MPKNFMQTMQGGKKVGIIYNVSLPEEKSNWYSIIQTSTENKINSYRYFSIVDISQRKDRLKEIVFSQSGLTSNEMEFGKELAVNGLIYVGIPKPPTTTCQTTKRTERRQGDCKKYQKIGENKTCIRYKNKTCVEYKMTPETRCIEYEYYYVDIYESTRTTTVFLKGELMNVETGAKIAYTNSSPYSSQISGTECQSELSSYNSAIDVATDNVVKNISPMVVDLKIAVESNPAGSPWKKRRKVKSYLKLGNESIKIDPPDFSDAQKYWTKALFESENHSTYAYWNLALHSWYFGNMQSAEQFFEKAAEAGGPKFIKKKRNYISIFKKEKERLSIESRAGR